MANSAISLEISCLLRLARSACSGLDHGNPAAIRSGAKPAIVHLLFWNIHKQHHRSAYLLYMNIIAWKKKNYTMHCNKVFLFLRQSVTVDCQLPRRTIYYISSALQKIKDLRTTAFDTDSPSVKNNTRFAQDYRKLGFTNEKDPTLDFMATPPGERPQ